MAQNFFQTLKILTRAGRRWGGTALCLALLAGCQATLSDFRAGLVAFDEARYPDAVAAWTPMAASGDPRAQNSLGWLYEKGLGVAQSDYKAAKWYRLASEQGYVSASLNLGRLYDDGRGVQQSHVRALALYREAAEAGIAEAENALGRMYLSGDGGTKDEPAAASWIKSAAEQGYPSAQNTLGLLYLKGQGVKKDVEKAYIWIKRASLNGVVGAEHNLAFAREFVERDHIKDLDERAAAF